MRLAFLMDALGVVGVSDSELSSAMRKARNQAIKERGRPAVKQKYKIKSESAYPPKSKKSEATSYCQ